MPRVSRKESREEQKTIAMERIGILFGLSDDFALSGNLEKSDAYVERARKIAMRYNLRIPSGYKRKFCKYCYRYLLPSATSIVRINPREHRVEVKCLGCGRIMYYPFVRELKDKRKNGG